MVRNILLILSITVLVAGVPLAKEFYLFPQVNRTESRDVFLLRRPTAEGFDNITGTRNISDANLKASISESMVCQPGGVYDGYTPIKGVDYFDGTNGATGPAGPANSLAIGSVATVDYGGTSAATITGDAPSQTLNLTLVQGPPGQNATVTQQAVLSVMADPGGDPLYRQPLAPQTDATAMIGTRDLSPGNVRWYVTGAGTMIRLDANGKKRLELDSDYSLKIYRGDGTTVAQQVYSSGRADFYGAVTIR